MTDVDDARKKLSGAIRRYYLKGLETGVPMITVKDPLTIDELEPAIGAAQDAFEAAVRAAATEEAQGRIEALERIVRVIAEQECNCGEAWTARGRHESNAWHSDYEDVIEDARDALGVTATGARDE